MDLEKSIIKALVYFDLFDYPLTKDEIVLYADRSIAAENLEMILHQLEVNQVIFKFEVYYSLRNDLSIIIRRKQGNKEAARLIPKAYRIASFLFKFPFVKGIGISGSLSKNFADKKSDIDFFVITEKNRLWIARTFMHIFKKLTFLTGHQHLFCMNYYVDEQALAVREKNIFTAIEVMTLLPACGNGSLTHFYQVNDWAKKYFPNYFFQPSSRKNVPDPWLKKSIEFLFRNQLGDKLDDFFLKLTTRRWKRKELQGRLNLNGNRMGLQTNKHFSKPNPLFFQNRILELYHKRLLNHSLVAS